jgi:hypothetical protein
MAKLKEVTVSLPWLSGTWGVDDTQQRAAWEIYVELVTRISVAPLAANEGLLREALDSLYVLFGETRRILRHYGPDIAIPDRKKLLSLGQIAVDVLNVLLRPFLAKWHPLLAQHERLPHPTKSNAEHEREWKPHNEKMRAELATLSATMANYADILARACGVPDLHRRSQ